MNRFGGFPVRSLTKIGRPFDDIWIEPGRTVVLPPGLGDLAFAERRVFLLLTIDRPARLAQIEASHANHCNELKSRATNPGGEYSNRRFMSISGS